MKSVSLLFVSLSYFFCTVQAQTNKAIPPQFQQFFQTYALTNPASIGRNSHLEVNAGETSMTGNFKGIRTIYANINYCFSDSSESKARRQIAGIYFINDKEGNFIKRNRASLMYSIHIPLKTSMVLNAGASAGFVNYIYEGTAIAAGGSDFTFSSDIGIWLHSRTYNIGIAMNQIFPGKLTPIEQTIQLKPLLNLNFDKSFSINPYLKIFTAINYRHIDSEYSTLNLALLAFLQNVITVGGTYKHNRGFALLGGINKIPLGHNNLKIFLSYYSPFSHTTTFNPQSLEISFNFTPHIQY